MATVFMKMVLVIVTKRETYGVLDAYQYNREVLQTIETGGKNDE